MKKKAIAEKAVLYKVNAYADVRNEGIELFDSSLRISYEIDLDLNRNYSFRNWKRQKFQSENRFFVVEKDFLEEKFWWNKPVRW